MTEYRYALIIGASSGTGLALAQSLASKGTRVALVARRADRLKEACDQINKAAGAAIATAYPYDVQDSTGVPALMQQILQELGGLDLVVYSAGIMPSATASEYSIEDDLAVLETNLLGAVAWLNEAARLFSKQQKGTIVGLTSVSGDRGRRGTRAYGASKAGLTTYLESLRNSLTVQGVHVATIKLGYVATDMIAGQKLPRFLPVISPEEAAQQILAVANSKQQTVYIPRIWQAIMALIKATPSPLFRKLNI
jgi:decaprenylphospho-beta-D-erythro-pentofuranosid-2-ulose 2-reductase